MLGQICAEIRNYFLRDVDKDIHVGTFSVQNGGISPLSFLLDGQYFRIVGSALNDGVWKYSQDGISGLREETFSGAIWAMAVPPDVIALADDIGAWVNANSAALNTPYSSESFGGYSYSLKSGGSSSGASGGSYGWREQFASRLSPYRRLSVL